MDMNLETNLSAKFIATGLRTAAEIKSMDSLNKHAEEITERLQQVFRLLIVEMLDIKRQQFVKEE